MSPRSTTSSSCGAGVAHANSCPGADLTFDLAELHEAAFLQPVETHEVASLLCTLSDVLHPMPSTNLLGNVISPAFLAMQPP